LTRAFAGVGGSDECDGSGPGGPYINPALYRALQWNMSQYNCPKCGSFGYDGWSCAAGCGGPFGGPATVQAAAAAQAALAGLNGKTPMNHPSFAGLGAPQTNVPRFLQLPGRAQYGMFAGLGAATGADMFASLSTAQQAWVLLVLANWFGASATQAWYNVNSTMCPGVTVGMDLTVAANRMALVACFQAWYNAQGTGGAISTAGALDSNTLSALIAWNGAAGGSSCPGNCVAPTPAPTSGAGSNTSAYVIGGLVVVALIGGIWYATANSHSHAAAGARR
jgi:hypothetical protein